MSENKFYDSLTMPEIKDSNWMIQIMWFAKICYDIGSSLLLSVKLFLALCCDHFVYQNYHHFYFVSCNFFPTSRPAPKRMLPQSSLLPISQPVKSTKYNVVSVTTNNAEEVNPAAAASAATSTANQPQLHAKHDLVVWFEVLELGESGGLYFYCPILVASGLHFICPTPARVALMG